MYQDVQIIKKSAYAQQVSQENSFKLARILLHSLSRPVLFVDQECTILMVNSNLADFLGCKQSELVQKSISTLLAQDQIYDFRKIQHLLCSDQQCWRGEFRVQNSHGFHARMETTVQRVELREQTIYLLFLNRVLADNQGCTGREEIKAANHFDKAANKTFQVLPQENRQYQKDLLHHIEVNLLPVLKKMSREPELKIRNYYQEFLARELISLTDGFFLEMDQDMLKLTPTEMEACKYIQSGLSSKEIAELMHSALDTTQPHRKNIRNKMGLKGQKTPLCTFLRVKKKGFQAVRPLQKILKVNSSHSSLVFIEYN